MAGQGDSQNDLYADLGEDVIKDEKVISYENTIQNRENLGRVIYANGEAVVHPDINEVPGRIIYKLAINVDEPELLEVRLDVTNIFPRLSIAEIDIFLNMSIYAIMECRYARMEIDSITSDIVNLGYAAVISEKLKAQSNKPTISIYLANQYLSHLSKLHSSSLTDLKRFKAIVPSISEIKQMYANFDLNELRIKEGKVITVPFLASTIKNFTPFKIFSEDLTRGINTRFVANIVKILATSTNLLSIDVNTVLNLDEYNNNIDAQNRVRANLAYILLVSAYDTVYETHKVNQESQEIELVVSQIQRLATFIQLLNTQSISILDNLKDTLGLDLAYEAERILVNKTRTNNNLWFT